MTCPMWVNPDGTFRTRIIQSEAYDEGRGTKRIFGKYSTLEEGGKEKSGRQDTGRGYVAKKPVTVGWTPLQEGWTPGVVLDPFCGSGTAGMTSLLLGRSFVGIDLYKSYTDLTESLCASTIKNMQERNLDPFSLSA
jgi:DNA modification methylase